MDKEILELLVDAYTIRELEDGTLVPERIKLYGENFTFNFEDWEAECDNLIMEKDNDAVKNVGYTFPGSEKDALFMLNAFITGFVNNEFYNIYRISDKISAIKDKYFEPSKFIINGRIIPQKLYTPNGDVCELDMLSDNCAAYVGVDDEIAVLVESSTGAIMTDIDSFYINGIVAEWKNANCDASNLIYTTDNFLEVINDYKEFWED